MSKYIDKDMAIEVSRAVWMVTGDKQVAKVTVQLEELPTADVQEVRHGHWEFIGGYGYQYRCSKCFMCAEHRTPYCAHCGAKMDK